MHTSADPFSDTTSYSYDVFGRLGQVVIPKDHNATPPVFITIPARVYDGNDNVLKSFDANSAVTSYTYKPVPNSLYGRLAAMRDEPFPQFPPALNIEWLLTK